MCWNNSLTSEKHGLVAWFHQCIFHFHLTVPKTKIWFVVLNRWNYFWKMFHNQINRNKLCRSAKKRSGTHNSHFMIMLYFCLPEEKNVLRVFSIPFSSYAVFISKLQTFWSLKYRIYYILILSCKCHLNYYDDTIKYLGFHKHEVLNLTWEVGREVLMVDNSAELFPVFQSPLSSQRIILP